MNKLRAFLRRNKGPILSTAAVGGLVATAVVSAKAGAKAERKIIYAEMEEGRSLDAKEKFKLVYKDYIPAASTVIATASVITGNEVSHQKVERELNKVVRKFEELKEINVPVLEDRTRNEIKALDIRRNPEEKDLVWVVDSYDGAKRLMDMDALLDAEDEFRGLMNECDVNGRIHKDLSLWDFHKLIGMRSELDAAVGWNLDWIHQYVGSLGISNTIEEREDGTRIVYIYYSIDPWTKYWDPNVIPPKMKYWDQEK